MPGEMKQIEALREELQSTNGVASSQWLEEKMGNWSEKRKGAQ